MSSQHLNWDCVFELVMFRQPIIFASDWFRPLFLFRRSQFYDQGYQSNVWIQQYLVYLAKWGRDFLTDQSNSWKCDQYSYFYSYMLYDKQHLNDVL